MSEQVQLLLTWVVAPILVAIVVGIIVDYYLVGTSLRRFEDRLRRAAFEHEVRFSRLHEKRAEVIADLYALLAKASIHQVAQCVPGIHHQDYQTAALYGRFPMQA